MLCPPGWCGQDGRAANRFCKPKGPAAVTPPPHQGSRVMRADGSLLFNLAGSCWKITQRACHFPASQSQRIGPDLPWKFMDAPSGCKIDSDCRVQLKPPGMPNGFVFAMGLASNVGIDTQGLCLSCYWLISLVMNPDGPGPEEKALSKGFNAQTGEYVDLIEAGVWWRGSSGEVVKRVLYNIMYII